MSLINRDIIDALSVWAAENEDKTVFSQISKDVDSYYADKDADESAYLTEYSFGTMRDLKEGLASYSGLSMNPEILRLMTVAVSENRFKGELEITKDIVPKKTDTNKKITANNDSELPGFIYVF